MVSTVEVLRDSLDKQVLVKLKGGKEVRGILKSFDQHLNLVLVNAEEGREGHVRSLGIVLVRGDNVVFISPA